MNDHAYKVAIHEQKKNAQCPKHDYQWLQKWLSGGPSKGMQWLPPKTIALADLGAPPARAPKGPDSFVLTYKFFET